MVPAIKIPSMYISNFVPGDAEVPHVPVIEVVSVLIDEVVIVGVVTEFPVP